MCCNANRHSNDFKVSLHFSTHHGGLLKLDKVEYVSELQPSPSLEADNVTLNGTSEGQPQNETQSAENAANGGSQDNDSEDGMETAANNSTDSGNGDSVAEGEEEGVENGSGTQQENVTSAKNETQKAEALKGGKPAKKKIIR